MKDIELLVFLLEKEVGPLKKTTEPSFNGSECYAIEFQHDQILLKIILIETITNHWVIHHEFSRENPLLLKKTARICDRFERIKAGNSITFSLSDDLKEILERNFISTAIKSCLQNLLFKYFSLYKEEKYTKDRNREGIYIYLKKELEQKV